MGQREGDKKERETWEEKVVGRGDEANGARPRGGRPPLTQLVARCAAAGEEHGSAVVTGHPPIMISPLPILLGLTWVSYTECYDAYYTCSKPLRSAKAKALYPCDLTAQTWCTIPGSYYPWRAVRRFVYENHGLMRRMYGDERHISVLRSEIDTNDIDYLDSTWAHDVNKYKLTKEELHRDKLSVTSTTSSSTTTPTTTAQLSSNFNETTPAVSIETTTAEEELSTPDDATTTDSTTTEDVTVTTTTQRLEEKTKPIIYQDTVEKPSPTTTESQVLFKSKGVNACPVKEEVVAPFWANNTRGEVLALLNLYPFEQYVHWERCTFENKQMFCRTGCKCEQQYRLHRLLAYDPTNDCRGIFSDWFRFPSCCVCRCYDLPGDIRLTSRSPRNSANSSST